jgi:hypothetical protein
MVTWIALSLAFGADFTVPDDGDLVAALASAALHPGAFVVDVGPGTHVVTGVPASLGAPEVTIRAVVPGRTTLALHDELVFVGGSVILEDVDLVCMGFRCLSMADGAVALERVQTAGRIGFAGGGVIAAERSTIVVRDTVFGDTTVSGGSGGILRGLDQSSVVLDNVWFQGGDSDTDGGHVRLEGSSLTVDRGLFGDGTASGRGGSLAVDAASTTLRDSTFVTVGADAGAALDVVGGLVLERSIVCDDGGADSPALRWSEGPLSATLRIDAALFAARGPATGPAGVHVVDGVGFAVVELTGPVFAGLSGDALVVEGDVGETIEVTDARFVDVGGAHAVLSGVAGTLRDPVADVAGRYVGWSVIDPVVDSTPGPLDPCAILPAGVEDLDGDGFVAGWDCDDTDARRHRQAVDDTCNGVDEDCDGRIDDDAPGALWYRDDDGDGAGDVEVRACMAPDGPWVALGGDCDDADPAVGAGPLVYLDLDGDGLGDPDARRFDCGGLVDVVANALDCDDADATRGPSSWSPDVDLDGLGDPTTVVTSCDPVPGHVPNADDCDDADALVGSRVWFLDADDDGFGDAAAAVVQCAPPAGHVDVAGDCDDLDPRRHPDASELCNGLDDDCDTDVDEGVLTTFFTDADGDGAGSTAVLACDRPVGHVTIGGDCDDGDPARSPLATEACTGVDDDCDGQVDEDLPTRLWWPDPDQDGFGGGDPVASCGPLDGHVAVDGDCAPLDASVSPAATERCDGIDEDCDGVVDEGLPVTTTWSDADGDGYGAGEPLSTCEVVAGRVDNPDDCNDATASIHPSASEVCNGVDDDCDEAIDEDCAPTEVPIPTPVAPDPAGCVSTPVAGWRWAPTLRRSR